MIKDGIAEQLPCTTRLSYTQSSSNVRCPYLYAIREVRRAGQLYDALSDHVEHSAREQFLFHCHVVGSGNLLGPKDKPDTVFSMCMHLGLLVETLV